MTRLLIYRYFSQSFLQYSKTSTNASRRILLDPKRWQIEIALVIYRLPKVAPRMSNIEKHFTQISEAIDHSTSYKCDFELKMDKDAMLLQKRKQLEEEGKDLSHLDEQLGISSYQLRDDWLQKADMISKRYFMANPIRECNSENVKSFERILDQKMILVVRQRFQEAYDKEYKSPWTLPQLPNKNNETLRQTTERCVKEILPRTYDDESSPYSFILLGNAPIGHYVFKYSHAMSRRFNRDGSIIFFYPTQFIQKKKMDSSKVELNNEKIIEHRWCTSKEFEELLANKRYKRVIRNVFIE